MTKYDAVAEAIAQKAVKENFFDVCKDGAFAMGVNTPHIVFNYLDYLLWYYDRDGKGDYSDFTFEFRNSVEHWYPQNSSEGTFEVLLLSGKTEWINLVISALFREMSIPNFLICRPKLKKALLEI